MHETPPARSTVLHAGTYHFRKRDVLIAGTVLLVASLVVIVFAVMSAGKHPWQWWEAALGALFPGGVIVMMGYCGAWLVVCFLRKKTLPFQLTLEGIHDRGRFTPWEEIEMLEIMGGGRGCCLCYHKRGRLSLRRALMQDPMLSREAAAELLMRLGDALKDRYPHLRYS